MSRAPAGEIVAVLGMSMSLSWDAAVVEVLGVEHQAQAVTGVQPWPGDHTDDFLL